jgi:hypothetical protein
VHGVAGQRRDKRDELLAAVAAEEVWRRSPLVVRSNVGTTLISPYRDMHVPHGFIPDSCWYEQV